MSDYRRSALFQDLPPTGNTTKWLCGLLIGVSVLGALAGRYTSFGPEELRFRADAVLQGDLWRVVTYAFVKTSSLGLLFSALVLWMFGRWYENSWGGRDFLRFFLASTIGGAILAIPLTWLLNLVMPFHDLGIAEGPDAAIDAMMVALALSAPNSNVLFGFILPVPARSIIFISAGHRHRRRHYEWRRHPEYHARRHDHGILPGHGQLAPQSPHRSLAGQPRTPLPGRPPLRGAAQGQAPSQLITTRGVA